MNICTTCGQVYLLAHSCSEPAPVKAKPVKNSDKSRLQEAGEERDRDDERSVIYCQSCVRPTDSDVMPIYGNLCAFCWPTRSEPEFYKQWLRLRFITIASNLREEKNLNVEALHYKSPCPGIDDIHHKSDSQTIIRCITTIVREHPAPPPVTLILRALDDCYLHGRHQLDFLHWRKAMSTAIKEVYAADRKRVIKASQGRQTDQLKINIF